LLIASATLKKSKGITEKGTMMILIVADFRLANSNGANDNFKGVATPYGSGTVSYRTALTLTTLATFLDMPTSTAHALTGALAETMGKRITDPNPGQGLTSNLVSAAPVLGVFRPGVSASTTPVSCVATCGIGMVSRTARWKTIPQILATWMTTLPLGLHRARRLTGH
jgi:PiT family inorganic phosphate transporter